MLDCEQILTQRADGRIFHGFCTFAGLKIWKSCASDRCDAHTHLSEWEEEGRKDRDKIRRYKHRIVCKEEPALLTFSTGTTAS